MYSSSSGKNLIIQNIDELIKNGYYISKDNNGKYCLYYRNPQKENYKLGILSLRGGNTPPPKGIQGEDPGKKDLILQIPDSSLISNTPLEYEPNNSLNAITQLEYTPISKDISTISNLSYQNENSEIIFTPVDLGLRNDDCIVDKSDRITTLPQMTIQTKTSHTYASHYQQDNYSLEEEGSFCDASNILNSNNVATTGNVLIIGSGATVFDKKCDGKCLNRNIAYYVLDEDYFYTIPSRSYSFGLYIRETFTHSYSSTSYIGEYTSIAKELLTAHKNNSGAIVTDDLLAGEYRVWHTIGFGNGRQHVYYDYSTGGSKKATNRITGEDKYVFPAYKLVSETETYTTSSGATSTYTSGYHIEDNRTDNSAIFNLGPNSSIEDYAEAFLSGTASVITSSNPK